MMMRVKLVIISRMPGRTDNSPMTMSNWSDNASGASPPPSSPKARSMPSPTPGGVGAAGSTGAPGTACAKAGSTITNAMNSAANSGSRR